ncbi:GNAT family N-acetyltransferase [Saccharibacillus alkalitolerans]|uniref:GNAT family N-acetyltransferase n=1 Tax=Saccharibacillus alkalitolerans TaxID=2705290 RepID=A0ABX0F4T1_9BACL|nr:GNAT family N-acetyltransferase [Saccharibacillus alkalitolerans]NGZ74895.1 GNAT family N-acetyltransferase [Saccharibacillus alkalitolerans]
MIDYRLMQSHELAEAARLSDAVFRQGARPSMAEMFPRLFSPRMPHSFGAFAEDGSLAAFMGLAPSTLRVGGAATIRAFSIGSVCTAPEHRGAGLAGRLLERCTAYARHAGAPLLFVSGDRTLYTRAGCVPFGRAANAVLRGVRSDSLAPSDFRAAADAFAHASAAVRRALYAPAAPPPLTVREAGTRDLLRLHGLYSAGGTAFEEGAAGLGDLIAAAAQCGVLGLEQRVLLASIEDTPVAYAVIGMPPHLKHYSFDGIEPPPPAPAGVPDAAPASPPTVIAYGGAPLYAADLLRYPAERWGLDELHIPVPWQEEELLSLLRKAGAEVAFGPNAGTLLITDPEHLLNQAQELWSRPWREALQTDGRGNLFAASGKRQIDRSEWTGLLFDPEYPRSDDVPDWLTPIPLPYLYGLHFT